MIFPRESERVKTLPTSPSPFLTPIEYKGQPKFNSSLCFTPKVNPRFLTPGLSCIKRGTRFIHGLCSSLCHFFWALGYQPQQLLFIGSRICWSSFLIARYLEKKKSHLHPSEDIFHFSAQALIWKPVVYKTMVWGKLGCLKRTDQNALIELLGNFDFCQ